MSRAPRAVGHSVGSGVQGVVAERLRMHGHSLSRAERLVAEYLATVSVEELPFLGAARIAETTGTSDATVTRAARRLGFSGLPELKRVGSRAGRVASSHADRLAQRAEILGGDAPSIVGAFHTALRELVDDNAHVLDVEALVRARDVVAGAQTVWAVGVGTSGVAAQHLADRLTRAGHPARWTRAAGFDLASELVAVRPEDVVVLIHGASPSQDFEAVISWTRVSRIRLVLVTGSQLAERHRDEADAVISCVGTASALVRWTLAALHAVELLALLVTTDEQDRAVDANLRLGELRRALGAAGGRED